MPLDRTGKRRLAFAVAIATIGPMGSIIRPEATLEERWEARSGPVLLTGTHALVRLPMLRQEMDAAAGLRTGGFISGYRGSPRGQSLSHDLVMGIGPAMPMGHE